MKTQSLKSKRREARRLFLTGDLETNADIARRLDVKPHTIGRWRKEEGWEDLRLKIDRRAAEELVEKLAGERTTLNVRHYKFWDVILGRASELLQSSSNFDVRDIERLAMIVDRAQKGQRLARGLSLSGETEEQIRAQSQAEIRTLIDAFVDAVKLVPDEELRDQIRLAVLEQVPDGPDASRNGASA